MRVQAFQIFLRAEWVNTSEIVKDNISVCLNTTAVVYASLWARLFFSETWLIILKHNLFADIEATLHKTQSWKHNTENEGGWTSARIQSTEKMNRSWTQQRSSDNLKTYIVKIVNTNFDHRTVGTT